MDAKTILNHGLRPTPLILMFNQMAAQEFVPEPQKRGMTGGKPRQHRYVYLEKRGIINITY